MNKNIIKIYLYLKKFILFYYIIKNLKFKKYKIE